MHLEHSERPLTNSEKFRLETPDLAANDAPRLASGNLTTSDFRRDTMRAGRLVWFWTRISLIHISQFIAEQRVESGAKSRGELPVFPLYVMDNVRTRPGRQGWNALTASRARSARLATLRTRARFRPVEAGRRHQQAT